MVKSVCFTGHRNIKVTQELSNRLYNQLEMLINNGADKFLAGGAIGWDLLCEKTVLKLREKYPHIKLHIIMPCPENEQTRKWKSDSDKADYHKILLAADYTEICSEHLDNECMKKRNARLVQLTDCCVCCYDKCRQRSGTGQTVRMAEQKGIFIINMYKTIGKNRGEQ